MIVAPHADDEVLGCGALIALASALGVEVTVLVITKGDSSLFTAEQTRAIRAEMAAAHKVLGVGNAICLDLPAPLLDTLPEHEVIDRLTDVITTIRPTTLMMPHAGDPHADHNVVSRAVLVATRPRPGQPVRSLLEYETPSETEWSAPDSSHWFIPNVYIDVSDHMSAKVEALACYASQIRAFPHPRSCAGLCGWSGSRRGISIGADFRYRRSLLGESGPISAITPSSAGILTGPNARTLIR
jgi:N-acetylglucosamine malate deacetylase 1